MSFQRAVTPGFIGIFNVMPRFYWYSQCNAIIATFHTYYFCTAILLTWNHVSNFKCIYTII